MNGLSPQLAMIGQMLASLVDMAKGQLGEQFAVSIIARHRVGPAHLLLGDDTELAIMGALSELQRSGTGLVSVTADGEVEPVERELSPTDHAFNLLQEAAEFLNAKPALSDTRDADAKELAGRIEQVLAMVAPTPAKICPRCVEPLKLGVTRCPLCKASVT